MKKDYPNCLLIEGSDIHLAVGLACGNKISIKTHALSRQHSLFLLEDTKSLLLEAGLHFSDLDLIAFTAGPGSFTGLRLVASAVQAIAFAHSIPVLPLSRFHIIAQSLRQTSSSQTILIAQEARQSEIYWGCYQYLEDENGAVLQADCLANLGSLVNFFSEPRALPGLFFVGSPVISSFLQIQSGFPAFSISEIPSPEQLIESLLFLACRAIKQGELKTAQEALPIYLSHWQDLA
jgi:tRNA threonylcarbamoyladenosine biosynthesis protein TsaB